MNTTAPSTAPLLEIRHLTTSFASEHGVLPVVDDVSLSVPPGACVGIVGESGCGKSAVAMSVVRLLPQPSSRIPAGQVLFHGQDLLSMPTRQLNTIRGAHIGVIFQEAMQALNPVQHIGDQIAEPLMRHLGLSEAEARARAVQLLEAVRVPAPAQRAQEYPHTLSGGMRQRAMIAIALACKPELIIADEPTTALDTTVQQQVLTLLHDLRQELNAACLLISHNLGVIAQNCDFVYVMYAGRVVECAPVRELFAHPQHAYTRALLAATIRPDMPRKSPLPGIPGNVPAPHEYATGCRFCQRMGRRPPLGPERPPFAEVTPGHFAELCPACCNEAISH